MTPVKCCLPSGVDTILFVLNFTSQFVIVLNLQSCIDPTMRRVNTDNIAGYFDLLFQISEVFSS